MPSPFRHHEIHTHRSKSFVNLIRLLTYLSKSSKKPSCSNKSCISSKDKLYGSLSNFFRRRSIFQIISTSISSFIFNLTAYSLELLELKLVQFLLKAAMSLTRRAFTSSLLAAPSCLAAAPLIDLSSGAGLFQEHDAAKNSDFFNLNGNVVGADNDKLTSPQAGRYLLYNIHTKEFLNLSELTDLWSQDKINTFLRDWRANATAQIDLRLVSALKTIIDIANLQMNINRVNIHSGFRTKKTNDMLRKSSSSVAEKSYHVQGRAVDFSIEGIPSRALSKIVLDNFDGGVGVYRSFLHVDTGPKRVWYG